MREGVPRGSAHPRGPAVRQDERRASDCAGVPRGTASVGFGDSALYSPHNRMDCHCDPHNAPSYNRNRMHCHRNA